MLNAAQDNETPEMTGFLNSRVLTWCQVPASLPGMCRLRENGLFIQLNNSHWWERRHLLWVQQSTAEGKNKGWGSNDEGSDYLRDHGSSSGLREKTCMDSRELQREESSPLRSHPLSLQGWGELAPSSCWEQSASLSLDGGKRPGSQTPLGVNLSPASQLHPVADS